MDKIRINQLHEFYNNYLFENCLPFWLQNSLDHEYGGYLTCLDREGKAYNTDKSVWFQGRGTWMFSRLYNTVAQKQEWLDAAKLGCDFLTKHCFDEDGRMFFTVTQDGRPLQKRRYMFSETFAVMACAEYSKASGDKSALDKALTIYDMIMDLYWNPAKLVPKINPQTRAARSLALPMILLNTTQTLREIDNNPRFDEITCELVETIFKNFYKSDEKALFETVGLNGERLDSPQGRCINPGHSIEAAWFIMHEGLHRNERAIIDKALEILDRSLELGWDKEYGGLLYFVDIEGKPAEQLEWDMKLWWPHTEALYALLLAHHITGDSKYEEWYEKIHEWSFSHFEDKTCGEWFGYLHRDGTVSNTLKGSMFKGPFHLPRALLFNLKLLEEMKTPVTKK
jgi:N-acylglucosamine 2-epimerase